MLMVVFHNRSKFCTKILTTVFANSTTIQRSSTENQNKIANLYFLYIIYCNACNIPWKKRILSSFNFNFIVIIFLQTWEETITSEYCCDGYTEKEGRCVPECTSGCINGICRQPDHCICVGGFLKKEGTQVWLVFSIVIDYWIVKYTYLPPPWTRPAELDRLRKCKTIRLF